MKTEHIQFAGSVPANYDKYLGLLLFEPYAIDLVKRIEKNKAKKVLEIACGTGRVTRHLITHLSPDASLIATDLNAGMIAIAQQNLQHSNLQFAQADALQLPYNDESFDLIVCQFGYMFAPDKQQAFKEAYRVLKSGGKLLFSTWDTLENNQLTLIIKNVVADYLDKAAADFYNVPFSMYDQQAITSLLTDAGFHNIHIDVVTKDGTHVTAKEAAKGLILGTPAFNIISGKDPDAPARLVELACQKLEQTFGNSIIHTELSALVCEATK